MLILFCRVLSSIAGLLLFFLFDQLSANECLKLGVLLAAFLLGIGGVLHARSADLRRALEASGNPPATLTVSLGPVLDVNPGRARP